MMVFRSNSVMLQLSAIFLLATTNIVHAFKPSCQGSPFEAADNAISTANNSIDSVPRLALLLCNEKSTSIVNDFDRQINQTVVLIKSVLITLEEGAPVHVILLCNKKEHFERIQEEIFGNPQMWDLAFTSRLKLEYVKLKYPKGKEWMRGLYVNHPCSSFRLFLPHILPYESVIYSDTDKIFFRNIYELWSEMSKFNSSNLVGMTPILFPKGSKRRIPHYGDRGASTALMLMNLTRMREAEWTKKLMGVTKPYFTRNQIQRAEEDMVNIYFQRFPGELHPISCTWNFCRAQCTKSYACPDKELRGGISMLHGTSSSFMKSGNRPLFRSIYETFTDTQLTKEFNLDDLIKRLRNGLDVQMKTVTASNGCSSIPGFREFILGRLNQKRDSDLLIIP